MKKIIISLFALFVIVVIIGGYYVWTNKETIVSKALDTIEKKVADLVDMPPYGEEEYIRSRYGHLLDKIDKAAADSNSIFKLGAAIEELKLPPEFVYVGITNGDEKTDIIKRFEWSGSGLTTLSGYGAGYLNGDKTIDIIIYEKEQHKSYMNSFVVYIEHKN